MSYPTPTGNVFVSSGGVAHSPWRIGEIRNGIAISTAELSDDEIEELGLTGLVAPAGEIANRLHGKGLKP